MRALVVRADGARVPIETCEVCAALVASEDMYDHVEWHWS